MFRALFLLLVACAGCGPAAGPTAAPEPAPEPDAPEWFRDVTAEARLDWRHRAGPTGDYFMPQVMGSGLAVFDADGDGRLDILVLTNAGPKSDATHRLFLRGEDGTYRDGTAGSGLGARGYGMGAAVGDFDNDGWSDVYISEYGAARLYRNRGRAPDGRWAGFEDVTSPAVAVPRWNTSCSFLDYDRDGWLDLVVVTYLDYDPSRACVGDKGVPDYCHPNIFNGTAARLFHNLGRDKGGKWRGFEDVTAASGLSARPSSGLGVACADFDGDGWVDIFAANDYAANHLWVNNRDGTFTERGVPMGVAYNGQGNRQANMGVAYADLHGHGRGDIFVTHLSEELHTLWKQELPGLFRDATAASGLGSPRWRGTGFGTVAADFDHDGNTDLAVVNGRVSRSRAAPPPGMRADLPGFWHVYAERNQLFAGAGGGAFKDISGPRTAYCGPVAVFRGLAWGDLDDDGAVDLVTTEIEGPVRVFKNVAPKAGHWLLVRAHDPALKREALGATVRVRAGERTRVGFVCPGQSHCSSGDPRVHFGLGAASSVDEIRVTWPDGSTESFPGGAVDRRVVVNRGEGRRVGP